MKRDLANAKHKAYEELYDKSDTIKGERFVKVGKTEKSSWEGCAAGEVDQGHRRKC